MSINQQGPKFKSLKKFINFSKDIINMHFFLHVSRISNIIYLPVSVSASQPVTPMNRLWARQTYHQSSHPLCSHGAKHAIDRQHYKSPQRVRVIPFSGTGGGGFVGIYGWIKTYIDHTLHTAQDTAQFESSKILQLPSLTAAPSHTHRPTTWVKVLFLVSEWV